jgi:uncharacterized protein (TIGR03663 family)
MRMKTQSRTSDDRTARPGGTDARGVAASTGTLPMRGTAPRRAEAVVVAPAAAPSEVVEARPLREARSWLTLENGLYLLFFALAIFTRFADLGTKGLHHDESLHAVYSWKYYMDQGYIHSPMMHGPEQFHFIDLFYLLFGATDATARFASATCGVFLVMAPWFLRRQLGRWPALIATFLILISPGFMYFTRFAREDAIYAAMEMLFVLGLWRFVDQRKPRDFYVMCAGYSLMFTIKESAYLTTAVIGLLLVGLFAWQMGRLLFSTFLAYLAGAGVLAVILVKITPKLPNIPAQDPTPENIQAFVTGLIAHPLVQVMAGVTVLWLAVWGYLLWDQSRRVRQAALAAGDGVVDEAGAEAEPVALEANGHSDATTALEANGYTSATAEPTLEASGDAPDANGDTLEAPGDGLEGEPATAPAPAQRPRTAAPRVPGLFERYQPGSLPYAVGYLLRNPVVLGTGVAIAALIYIALYTSLFSNINGIGTGAFGSIGYWLAQQDVRRGDQPWFYYGLLIPIYEPLIILFGAIGILYFAWRGVQALVTDDRRAALLFVLAVLFFPIAIPVFIVLMLVRAFRRAPEDAAPVVPGVTPGFNAGKRVEFAEFRPFLALFLTAWFLGAFALYSWAGEKMPWLMIHMVQPLAFLAALALGHLATSMIRNRRRRAAAYAHLYDEDGAELVESPVTTLTGPTSWFPFFSFISLFGIVSVFFAMSITHRVVNNNYDNWWQLLIWPALLLLIIAGYWSMVGGSRVLRYTLVGLLGLLSVYGIRSAVQLSFYHASDAREMAVYVQTSPDVTRAADTLDRLSMDQTGARDLKVMYDSQTSWPWEWYLRDYKNKQFQPSGPATAPAPDVAVLILDSAWYDKAKSGQAPQLSNYVGTKYVMRWWFPEDTYRNFIPATWDDLDPAQPVKPDGTPNYKLDANGKQIKAPVRQIQGALDTILYTLRTPAEQGKLWNYLIYRQPYAALGSTDMAVFVRKDLQDRYNYLASLNLPNYDSLVSH